MLRDTRRDVVRDTKKLLAIACAIALLGTVSGCAGKPGGYKGAKDPLVAKLDKPELQQALKQRLLTADTPR
jgi:hypothetical protein